MLKKSFSAGPGAKKTKRVSDINALGISSQPVIKPPSSSSALPLNQDLHGIGSSTNYFSPNLNTLDQGYNPYQTPTINPQYDITQTTPNPNISQTGSFNQQFAMLQQPMVQDMAFQYGQKLADQGKDLVNKEFEKYVSVTKLKYYFAVDNRYVMSKLRLLFFPFAHRDWSLKYDQGEVAQPRDDINCPDLYIPLMGYITFIVMAGLILGMNERFSPEQLGIQASSALAYNIFELIIYTVTIYVTNIQTNLRTLDLVAYSGYKYASIVAILCGTITFSTTGYWILLIYCGFSLTFFLVMFCN